VKVPLPSCVDPPYSIGHRNPPSHADQVERLLVGRIDEADLCDVAALILLV